MQRQKCLSNKTIRITFTAENDSEEERRRRRNDRVDLELDHPFSRPHSMQTRVSRT
jgi:hypothetical protein